MINYDVIYTLGTAWVRGSHGNKACSSHTLCGQFAKVQRLSPLARRCVSGEAWEAKWQREGLAWEGERSMGRWCRCMHRVALVCETWKDAEKTWFIQCSLKTQFHPWNPNPCSWDSFMSSVLWPSGRIAGSFEKVTCSAPPRLTELHSKVSARQEECWKLWSCLGYPGQADRCKPTLSQALVGTKWHLKLYVAHNSRRKDEKAGISNLIT